MDALTIASERARPRRRIVVLDDAGRIISAQTGTPVDDRLFRFSALANRLPREVEESVRLAIATEGCFRNGFAITQFLHNDNIGVRVFQLKRGENTHVGLVFEIVRRRAADP